MFHQPLFSKRPESSYTIDIHLSLIEVVLVVNIEMFVSAEHERITPHHLWVYTIDPHLIFFNGLINQGFCFDIREDMQTETFPPVIRQSYSGSYRGIISSTDLASQPLLTHQVIVRTATRWTIYPFNSVNLIEKIVKCLLFRLACFD